MLEKHTLALVAFGLNIRNWFSEPGKEIIDSDSGIIFSLIERNFSNNNFLNIKQEKENFLLVSVKSVVVYILKSKYMFMLLN